MPSTGITIAGDVSARLVDTGSPRIDCVEVPAEGFFARPSPYLRALGRRVTVLVRASRVSFLPSVPFNARQVSALADVANAAHAQWVIHGIGYRGDDGLDFPSAIPLSLTPDTLAATIAHLSAALAVHRRRGFVEPTFSLLRVPGAVSETDYLTRLCDATGTRLLLDTGTLVARARNHGIDPVSWVRTLPAGLIGAVRHSPVSVHGDRCHPDAAGAFTEESWALVDLLLTHGRPDVLLLQHEPAEEVDGVRIFDRLARSARGPGRRAVTEPTPEGRGLRPAPDVALFVLDHEGVCYAGSRQELALLNTPATFIWCLMEEGLSVGEIGERFARTFELPTTDARRQVAAILRQWYGLGYIDDPGPLDAPELPLHTAIGYLLTNRGLRASFRTAPSAVADRLGVASTDIGRLVALDPDELDAQADAFARHAAVDEGPRLTPLQAAAETPVSPALCLRLASTTFALAVAARSSSLPALRSALSHLSCEPCHPDVSLAVQSRQDGHWTISDGDTVLAAGHDADGLVPATKQLLRQMAARRHAALLSVHAGIVAYDGNGVLLPAMAGSGKTTLVAALVHAGATYLSDEIALLDGEALRCTPVPLALTVKDGALAPLRTRYPDLDHLPVHVREDGVRVRYLPPPLAALPDQAARVPVRHLVFPTYDASCVTALTPLDRPAALRRLFDEAHVDRRHMSRRQVEAIVGWMRGVTCFALRMSSLDEAVSLIRDLARGIQPGVARRSS